MADKFNRILHLIELRNLVAEATDKALQLKPEAAHGLLAIECIIASEIVASADKDAAPNTH